MNLIKPALPDNSKLSKFCMLLMFLVKLRLNLFDEDMATRFAVHQTTVSRNFHRVLDIMAVKTTLYQVARQRNIAPDNANVFPQVFKNLLHYNRLYRGIYGETV